MIQNDCAAAELLQNASFTELRECQGTRIMPKELALQEPRCKLPQIDYTVRPLVIRTAVMYLSGCRFATCARFTGDNDRIQVFGIFVYALLNTLQRLWNRLLPPCRTFIAGLEKGIQVSIFRLQKNMLVVKHRLNMIAHGIPQPADQGFVQFQMKSLIDKKAFPEERTRKPAKLNI